MKKKPLRQGALGGGGVWEKGGSHKMLEGKKEIIVLEDDDGQLKFW